MDPSGRAALLVAQAAFSSGRHDRVLELLKPFADGSNHELLDLYARALRASEHFDAAVAVRRHQVALLPKSASAWLNLAAALNDLGARAEAVCAATQGIDLGSQAPEAWLVLARAFRGQGNHAAAEDAYRQGLARGPQHYTLHEELSQLVWRRTGDALAATAALDELKVPAPRLLLIRANVLETAGEANLARETLLRLVGQGSDPGLLAAAATILAKLDPAIAHETARRATSAAARPDTVAAFAQSALSIGDTGAALAAVKWLLARQPLDQLALALLATCYRLRGDPAYDDLIDYKLVRSIPIAAPAAWPEVPAFLSDLADELRPLHDLPTHPVGMSLRSGSQTTDDLRKTSLPAISAARSVLSAAVEEYLATLSEDQGPFTRRKADRAGMTGLWSVRLRPGGFHTSHIHPDGWLSSAFYVALPGSMSAGHSHAGALGFGSPGISTPRPLGFDHVVDPQAGHVVLFPSYFWHATIPFEGHEGRLTMAFDAVPVS